MADAPSARFPGPGPRQFLQSDSTVVGLQCERMDLGGGHGGGGRPGVKAASARMIFAGAKFLIGNRDPTLPGGARMAVAAARQGLGLVIECVALIGSDAADGRLRGAQERHDKLPTWFVVTLPGSKRAAARAFLKWLRSRSGRSDRQVFRLLPPGQRLGEPARLATATRPGVGCIRRIRIFRDGG